MLCKYVLAIALVRIVYYLNHCVNSLRSVQCRWQQRTGAGSGSEKGEWSNDQLRWDAKEQEYKAEALTCRFGGGCRQGLNCPYRHSQEEIQIFVDERDLRRRKLMIRCGFCARGECKFEGCCARSLRVAVAVPDAADSDYESADSNDCH